MYHLLDPLLIVYSIKSKYRLNTTHPLINVPFQSAGDLQNDEETAAIVLHMVQSSGKLMSALNSEGRGSFQRLSSKPTIEQSRSYLLL